MGGEEELVGADLRPVGERAWKMGGGSNHFICFSGLTMSQIAN